MRYGMNFHLVLELGHNKMKSFNFSPSSVSRSHNNKSSRPTLDLPKNNVLQISWMTINGLFGRFFLRHFQLWERRKRSALSSVAFRFVQTMTNAPASKCWKSDVFRGMCVINLHIYRGWCHTCTKVMFTNVYTTVVEDEEIFECLLKVCHVKKQAEISLFS